jgi:hypothetical protein
VKNSCDRSGVDQRIEQLVYPDVAPSIDDVSRYRAAGCRNAGMAWALCRRRAENVVNNRDAIPPTRGRIIHNHGDGQAVFRRKLSTSISIALSSCSPDIPSPRSYRDLCPRRNRGRPGGPRVSSWQPAGWRALARRRTGRIWSTLGDGIRGIAEEAGRLCTAYRRDQDDVVIAMDGIGQAIWERARCVFQGANARTSDPGLRCTDRPRPWSSWRQRGQICRSTSGQEGSSGPQSARSSAARSFVWIFVTSAAVQRHPDCPRGRWRHGRALDRMGRGRGDRVQAE